jgi:hypothetical protein
LLVVIGHTRKKAEDLGFYKLFARPGTMAGGHGGGAPGGVGEGRAGMAGATPVEWRIAAN